MRLFWTNFTIFGVLGPTKRVHECVPQPKVYHSQRYADFLVHYRYLKPWYYCTDDCLYRCTYSKTIYSKGFRKRKLQKPPDKTTTVAHARLQNQLNNLVIWLKADKQSVSEKPIRLSSKLKCNSQPLGFHATIFMEFNSKSTQDTFYLQETAYLGIWSTR